MRIKNLTRGTRLAESYEEARSLAHKIAGLLGRAEALQPGEAFVIASACPWIHTFFMGYTIDLVFITADGLVVGTQTLRPWQLSKIYRKASCAIELPHGAIARSQTHVGDRIAFSA